MLGDRVGLGHSVFTLPFKKKKNATKSVEEKWLVSYNSATVNNQVCGPGSTQFWRSFSHAAPL